MSGNDVAKLTPSGGTEGGNFGMTPAVWGERSVFGAFAENNFRGACYVFFDWVEVERLEPLDPEDGSYFGRSVAVAGEYMVGGATEQGFNGQGSAYLFRRLSNLFVQVAKIVADDGQPGDLFGDAVAVTETAWVYVGAPGHNEGTGAVYVFETRDSTNWNLYTKLLSPEPGPQRLFGATLSLDGPLLAVSAPNHDVARGNVRRVGAGATFLYSVETWDNVGTLIASDGSDLDGFGRSVVCRNQTCIVGAPKHDVGDMYDAGAAYIFNDAWVQVAKLVSREPFAGQHFGSDVDIRHDAVVVGANQFSVPRGDPGSAELFCSDDGDYVSLERMTTDNYNDFGIFVALDPASDVVIVSALADENADAVATGAVYLYDVPCPGKLPPANDPSSSSSSKKSNNISLQPLLAGLALGVGLLILLGYAAILLRRRYRSGSSLDDAPDRTRKTEIVSPIPDETDDKDATVIDLTVDTKEVGTPLDNDEAL